MESTQPYTLGFMLMAIAICFVAFLVLAFVIRWIFDIPTIVLNLRAQTFFLSTMVDDEKMDEARKNNMLRDCGLKPTYHNPIQK